MMRAPTRVLQHVRGDMGVIGYHGSLALLVLACIVVGSMLHVAGVDRPAHLTWAAADVIVLGPLTWGVVRELLRGRIGVDVIALGAIVGALALGEYLAGAVIALMLAGGNALEEYARSRAGRELGELVARAPREAHVRRAGSIHEVAAADVVEGDIVVVRTGEVVPVDGYVRSDIAVVDQSMLTGEPIPVTLGRGSAIASGSSNAGDSFEAVALRTANESMYAGIVRLVEQAVERKAPMVRMADRYSIVFLIVTVALAGGSWAITGDPMRALAVLVIATPCPLILAPPVALVAGTSRAARKGIIVKGAAAIETLGRAGTVLIDKTGTITIGTPTLGAIHASTGFGEDQLLRLAASVEQMSVHTVAEAIAHAGQERTGELPLAEDVHEQPGHGISGTVEGHRVVVGSRGYLQGLGIETAGANVEDGRVTVHVAVDGVERGTLELTDRIRTDALGIAAALRAVGVDRIAMATGDHLEVAQRIAGELGISEVHANCTPQEKLEILDAMRASNPAASVIMVGDGVNDAPALAAADVGIAMGSAGATAASEAAEAVIISSQVSAVVDAIAIGRRSTSIARQSVIGGMSLSMIGMVVAAFGFLPPIYGALAQEGIDLAVILNALRALVPARSERDALA